MEPSRLRSIVAFSAAATLLYTPLFKKLTAIKNATVATVIALAPLAGALAAGAVRGGMKGPALASSSGRAGGSAHTCCAEALHSTTSQQLQSAVLGLLFTPDLHACLVCVKT